jgi:hypothetical protein
MTGIIKCPGIDWFLFSLLILIAVVLAIISIFILRKETLEKIKVNYPFGKGDFKSTPKLIIKLLTIALISGFAVGSLGISVGLILNPIYI